MGRRRPLGFDSLDERIFMSVTPISGETEALTLIAGFTQVTDADASGGHAVQATARRGEMRGTFEVATDGVYVLTLRAKAPTAESNEILVSVDGSSKRTWAFDVKPGYQDKTKSLQFSLTAGTHRIAFFSTEVGILIDRYEFNLKGAPVDPPPPANTAPKVSAGVDQTAAGVLTATLAGVASDDGLPTGGTLATQWSKVSGPGGVTFADPAAKNTAATFSQLGTYVLRLTASDGTLSASDDVTIAVTTGPVEPPPGPVVLITGDRHSQVLISNPANGTTFNFALSRIFGDQNHDGLNTVWPDPVEFGHKSAVDHNAYPSCTNVYPLSFKGEARDITISGATVIGEFDPKAPWHIWKGVADGDAVRVEGLGNVTLRGIRVDNKEDGLAPRTANDSKRADVHFTISDSYFTRIHDDMVENDSTENLVIRDSFMQGHTFYSSRGTPNPAAQVRISNMVVELTLLPHQGRISGTTGDYNFNTAGGYPYPDGLGVGALLKLDGGGKDGTIVVEDSVFLVPRYSTSSNDGMRLDQLGVSYRNVTVVWLGDGAYPGTIPAGVTLTRDRTAFDQAKIAFFASHPQFAEGQTSNTTAPV